jgi:hypothetical protein
MKKELYYSVGEMSDSEWWEVNKAVREYREKNYGHGYWEQENTANFEGTWERSREEALQALLDEEYVFDI